MDRRALIRLSLLTVLVIGMGILLVSFPFVEETQGTGTRIGDEFIMVVDGFRGDDITWLVVLNWPAESTSPDRLNDGRFDELGLPRSVVAPSGERLFLTGLPRVYFFDGPALTTFPVKMTPDDITELHGHFRGMKDYRELLPLLRRYECKDE